jgi:Tfp pilus assembly protein PilF
LDNLSFTTPVQGQHGGYAVRTVFFESIQKILISIVENEKMLHTEENAVPPHLSEKELADYVKEAHDQRVASFVELFKISAKLELKPEAESNKKLGMVFLTHGMGREARAAFERALKVDPDNASLLKQLGLSELMENQTQEAKATLKKALELKPNYPDVHNALALALLQNQELDEAVAELNQALAIHPNYAEANLNLTIALLDLAELDKNMPADRQAEMTFHLSRAIEQNSAFNNEYLKVAKNYIDKKLLAEARQALEQCRAAGLAQRGAEVYHEFYLRLKYGEEGVDRKATEDYITRLEKILEAHPNYVDIHNDLGIAYLIQCRFLFNRAINEFKAAIAINDSFAPARKNLKLAENEGKGFLILLRAILYF